MPDSTIATNKPKGNYGVDGSFHVVSARGQALGVGATSAALLGGATASLARGKRLPAALAAAAGTGVLAFAGLWIYVSLAGKFRVWDRILAELRLQGDETLLDMGCGRGAVLLAAAKRLPRGRAIGVDMWQADQTGNSQQATLDNAFLENVADRIEVHTGDMTALPLQDSSVDVVVSNLAIHNIPTREGRRRALVEAVRVLRPGGRLAVADLRDTRNHATQLRELGWHNVQHRNLGWRMWFGGPWVATRLVTGTKPA
jgi:SAM-dependent methyltransferase